MGEGGNNHPGFCPRCMRMTDLSFVHDGLRNKIICNSCNFPFNFEERERRIRILKKEKPEFFEKFISEFNEKKLPLHSSILDNFYEFLAFREEILEQPIFDGEEQIRKFSEHVKKTIIKKTQKNPPKNKKFIGKLIDGTKVYVVNGNWARKRIIGFALGGHGYVYDEIPKNSIWIEITPDADKTLMHEIIEYILMKYKGFSYNKAHKFAESCERVFDDVGAMQ